MRTGDVPHVKRAAPVLAAALVLSGCGGGGSDARSAVRETASKLGQIRSGILTFRLAVTPRGRAGAPFGYSLRGPFALSKRGGLPVARVVYTQEANGRTGSATIVSTGRQAFVAVRGRFYALGSAQASQLRRAGGGGGNDGLAGLHVDRWIRDERVADGGEVGGAQTDRVRGDIDVVAAVDDLLAFVRQSGASVPKELGEADAERLRDATRSASLELYTGKDDRLLRRLVVDADLGFAAPRTLRDVLGSLVGARIHFQLGITRPNTPVHVSAPKNALPYSALGSGP